MNRSSNSDSLPRSMAFARLDELYQSIGPQAFGSLMQRVLAGCFEGAGFEVISNPVGVPDLIVRRRSEDPTAIEVKTGNPVILSRRDLSGVTAALPRAAIAVLVFPDLDPRWVFVDAHTLMPGKWESWQLRAKPQVDIGFDHKQALRKCLSTPKDLTKLDPSDLAQLARAPYP